MSLHSRQPVPSGQFTPAIELLILLEIIEVVSSDECGGAEPFKAAAVNYLAGRARVIAGGFADTRNERSEREDLKVFVRDVLVEATQSTLTAAEIWAAYLNWCRNTEETPVTQTMLGRRLREMGFSKRESNGVVRYVGVALFAPEPEKKD